MTSVRAPCPACQASTLPNARFCDHCGHRLAEQPSPALWSAPLARFAEFDLDLYGTYDETKHTVEFDGKLNPYGAVALSVRHLSLGFVVPVAVVFPGIATERR